MKPLFEISLEEKQRIIEMHEMATKNNYLSEQTLKKDGKIISKKSYATSINQEDGKFSKKFNSLNRENPNYESEKNKLETSVNEILKNEDSVRKLLDGDEQIQIWDEILKNAKYFAADVIYKVISKSGKPYKYARLGTRNTISQLKTEADKTEGGVKPGPFQEDTITFPSNKSQTGFFENNAWNLSQTGVDEFYQTFIVPYVNTLNEYRKSFPGTRMCIKNISINASASRFRNRGEAQNMTFKQLSDARAKSTYEFLIEQYQKIKGNSTLNGTKWEHGGTQWCEGTPKFVINSDGQNGDGTSGPNPPYPNLFLPKGGTQFVYGDPNTAKGKQIELKRNEFGEPIKSTDEGGGNSYEKFRYVIPTVNIVFDYNLNSDEVETTEPDTTEPDEFVDPKTQYWAVLRYNTWKINIKIKWPKISWIKRKNSDNSLTTKNAYQCPGIWKVGDAIELMNK